MVYAPVTVGFVAHRSETVGGGGGGGPLIEKYFTAMEGY